MRGKQAKRLRRAAEGDRYLYRWLKRVWKGLR